MATPQITSLLAVSSIFLSPKSGSNLPCSMSVALLFTSVPLICSFVVDILDSFERFLVSAFLFLAAFASLSLSNTFERSLISNTFECSLISNTFECSLMRWKKGSARGKFWVVLL